MGDFGYDLVGGVRGCLEGGGLQLIACWGGNVSAWCVVVRARGRGRMEGFEGGRGTAEEGPGP